MVVLRKFGNKKIAIDVCNSALIKLLTLDIIIKELDFKNKNKGCVSV